MSGMNYNKFMELVLQWGVARCNYELEFHSGKYRLRREAKLAKRRDDLFNRVCKEASLRFPGGKAYDAAHPTRYAV